MSISEGKKSLFNCLADIHRMTDLLRSSFAQTGVNGKGLTLAHGVGWQSRQKKPPSWAVFFDQVQIIFSHPQKDSELCT
jgi:hypothetical protein